MRWQAANGYTDYTFGSMTYLLPYGQNIVNFKRGVQINESGLHLWRALQEGATESELLLVMRTFFEAEDEDMPLLQKDLEEYLKKLQNMGMLVEAEDITNCHFYRTGPLGIALDCPQDFFDKYFGAFTGDADGAIPHQVAHIICVSSERNTLAGKEGEGTVLIQNYELILSATEQEYIFHFPTLKHIYEMRVTRDGRLCNLYCDGNLEGEKGEAVFHALRFAFLVLAQNKGMAVVHSASLLYRDRAWLFSGKSGTGKSTHTNLWKETFDTILLNGDLNLLGPEGEQVYVYGLPWCGTSGILTPKSYPLGGVIFLHQCRENHIKELDRGEREYLLAMRMITPAWTEELLRKNLDAAEKIARNAYMAQLYCTKEPDAAYVMRRGIDCYLNKQN